MSPEVITVSPATTIAEAREVMRRNPSCVERSASIREAASLMSGNGLGCIPVVADGALCGIVTTADLLRAIAP